MGTTWIDLTDMLGWAGAFGGTQRVVYGIAYEYYLEAQGGAVRVGFFYYDAEHDMFMRTDFEELIKRKELCENGHELQAGPQGTGVRARKIIKKILPPFIKNNPEFIVKTEFILRSILHQVRKIKKRLHRNNEASTEHLVAVRFEQDDVILFLGKPWDTPAMMGAMQEQKELVGFRVGTVIYDLVISLRPHLHSPQLFAQYTRYLFEAATMSDFVLPISKSSEADMFDFCDCLKISPPKSYVIRIGDVMDFPSEPTPPRDFERYMNDPFILCVGTIEVRKNHALLYNTYKLARAKGINLPRLVIVGRLGWCAGDIYTIMKNDPEMAGLIEILENVTDGELAWLYDSCVFSVYPSMYEGWGLPVAESLQHGRVVIASSSSSIPEIAGEILEYFSPYSTDELLHLLVKYLDEPYRHGVEGRIGSEYASTSWSDTYGEVRAAIASLGV